MMKKKFLFALSFALLVCALSLSAFAYEHEDYYA